MNRIDPERLRNFATSVFEKVEVPASDAHDAADVLVWANRRGVDTHGVRNLKPFYVDGIARGDIIPNPRFRIEQETPVTARVDGDNGLGMVGGCWAMRLAMKKAEEAGIGVVSMCHSNHYGAAGYYPMMALQKGMIGISMTGYLFAGGSEVGVRPTFGATPMLSTNPISVAFPTAEEPPFLLDMATSVVPMNRIQMLIEAGADTIPAGWGLDSEGKPTTDPGAVRHLFPLGGTREQGGHKGFGLSMMVTVFCSLLSGGWFEGATKSSLAADGYGQDRDAHFFAALNVEAFRPLEEFRQGMDAMIRAIHAGATEPGQDRIYVAGEIEHETEQSRLRDGIPLPPNVVADLQTLSNEFGVPLDL